MENNQEGMDNSKKEKMACNCGMCRMGGAHIILRWVLGIVILLLVFWLGIMVGSFRHSYGQHRGGYMMGHYPNPIMRAYPMSGYGSGTMRGTPGTMGTQTATSTPASK